MLWFDLYLFSFYIIYLSLEFLYDEEKQLSYKMISDYLFQIYSLILLFRMDISLLSAFFLLPFVFFYNALDRNQRVVKVFLASYAFSSIYVFLWSISSFWVVWYGIVMYFIFFYHDSCFTHISSWDRCKYMI